MWSRSGAAGLVLLGVGLELGGPPFGFGLLNHVGTSHQYGAQVASLDLALDGAAGNVTQFGHISGRHHGIIVDGLTYPRQAK